MHYSTESVLNYYNHASKKILTQDDDDDDDDESVVVGDFKRNLHTDIRYHGTDFVCKKFLFFQKYPDIWPTTNDSESFHSAINHFNKVRIEDLVYGLLEIQVLNYLTHFNGAKTGQFPCDYKYKLSFDHSKIPYLKLPENFLIKSKQQLFTEAKNRFEDFLVNKPKNKGNYRKIVA